jgi:hypothetical protein
VDAVQSWFDIAAMIAGWSREEARSTNSQMSLTWRASRVVTNSHRLL